MRTAIVTGSAGGIGSAICAVLKREGYIVIGLDRERGDTPTDHFLQCDLRHLHRSAATAQEILSRMDIFTKGRLDLLVNNAAYQVVKPIEKINREDWDDTFSTNVAGPFFLTQHFLPLIEVNRGSVVNIGSIHANLTKPKFVAYATSKGALVTMTRAMAVELGPKGVRVNAVLPAATDTPMLRDGFKDNPVGYDQLARFHPMQRITRAEEVAELVAFLASEKATFISGGTYSIDGAIGAVLHDP